MTDELSKEHVATLLIDMLKSGEVNDSVCVQAHDLILNLGKELDILKGKELLSLEIENLKVKRGEPVGYVYYFDGEFREFVTYREPREVAERKNGNFCGHIDLYEKE